MKQLHRILHVDDAEDVLFIAEVALKVIGQFEILQCASGQQAITKAEAFQPDLLLLDYMMPEMDGKETLDQLRKLPGLADVPVVFMTARVSKEFSDGLRDEGALDVVAKPFDPMTLATHLRSLWQSHVAAQPE